MASANPRATPTDPSAGGAAGLPVDGKPRGLAVFRGFHPMFWVINGIELLERGAWYGMLAVFSYHLVFNLGIAPGTMGALQGLMLLLAYLAPLPAAALAEKYGYRVSLAVSFGIVASGYALMSVSTEVVGLFAAAVLLGVGSGVFKPLPAAVVAQTSPEEKRNLAYVIYYWAINLGAFSVPLAVGIFFPGSLFLFAFYLATGMAVVNIALSLFVYRNVAPPQPGRTIRQALAPTAEVLRNRTFVVLLLIYSGFWFVYSMNWSFLQVYYEEYVAHPEWLNVALLFTINPGVILALGPVLGKAVEKLPSLPLMIGGMGVFVGGFVLLGFTLLWPLVAVGIFLISVGEILTHPGFLSYVSKVAPKDRVGIYLGAGMLPLGLGLFTGPIVGGVVYEVVSDGLSQPKLFWAFIATVGLLTIASMVLYNRWLTRRQAGPAPGPPAGPAPPSPQRRGFPTGIVPAVVALLLIPALLGAGAVLGPDGRIVGADGAGEGGITPASQGSLVALEPFTAEGTSQEGGDPHMHEVQVPPEAIGNATFTLAWTDEAPPGGLPGTTNRPDRFRVTLLDAAGEERGEPQEGANPEGGEGRLTLEVPLQDGDAGAAWTLRIEALDCGDVVVPPGLVTLAEDHGNAWTLVGVFEGLPPAGPDSADSPAAR